MLGKKIRNEDRVEFAFEDHRWWDVRRWMIAPNTLGAPLRGVNITKDPTTAAFTYTPFIVENPGVPTKDVFIPNTANRFEHSWAIGSKSTLVTMGVKL